MDSAIAYNKKNAIPVPAITSAEVASLEYAQAIRAFQEEFNLKPDGKMGPTTLAHIRQYILNTHPIKTLGEKDYVRIADIISKFEGHFWSCNRNGEFRGLFDRPDKKHWASGNTHIGLSYGFIQFTQDGGSLGLLLKLMMKKDPEGFLTIFGERSDDLIKTTNLRGRNRVDGRSPRVQPVGGKDLWSDYWVDRFTQAGKHPAFQDAQLELAVKSYMNPAIKTCQELNISSERGLAIVFDRSVQYGPRGAKNLIVAAGGPSEEHFRLLHLLNTWEDKRWHHRVRKIFMNQTLTDSTCVFG